MLVRVSNRNFETFAKPFKGKFTKDDLNLILSKGVAALKNKTLSVKTIQEYNT
jgi:hypothetical protein